MPVELNFKTATDVVKFQHPGYSEDEAIAPAGIGELPAGTVMAMGVDGTLAVLAAAGGGAANCVLLSHVEADNAEKRVVVLTRHAEVVRQALEFPDGYAAGDADAAIAALRDLGIVARRGV